MKIKVINKKFNFQDVLNTKQLPRIGDTFPLSHPKEVVISVVHVTPIMREMCKDISEEIDFIVYTD